MMKHYLLAKAKESYSKDELMPEYNPIEKNEKEVVIKQVQLVNKNP